jgi:putative protein kinase ArgK-like GTPase of G3E family
VIIELVNLRKLFTNRIALNSSLATELIQGNRAALAKAITLAESQRPADQDAFRKLLVEVLPATGKSFRIGITGAPGVGKSSFIEALGNLLTEQRQRVAVLSIDPSSPLTLGSILGDKTRPLSGHPLQKPYLVVLHMPHENQFCCVRPLALMW